ncbi:hypothetical protein TRAPUB_4277 [Trametes pubescens]|uniref:Uncharacterized protein n=1 Tax=Trametes pubescens TaxID=154538 RepID=A0A1M2VBK5_TRAPU|nr:hypothetical protein TRAPUB_4277 [Trametes pubescens]
MVISQTCRRLCSIALGCPALCTSFSWGRAVPPLDVTGVLNELATGAYNHIEQLPLEAPHRVDVDDDMGDVERLRAHVRTVEVRVVETTPMMELPEYCAEPAASPSDEPWPYRLW